MFQSSLVSPSFTCASYRGSAPKMRLKQDPFYTRYGGTHVFLEPSDAMFDLKPFCPVPSFTRRKKVNRVYRRNRAGRKLIVGMFYNVVVGEEAVIIGEEAVEQEAGVPETVVLGEGPEVLDDEDQVVEEVLLDEGDEADLLASLLEAKGAAGSPK